MMIVFLWQWIVRAPGWKMFRWTKNTKLNAFISTYHAPYYGKHRYWTGLLLLVRVLLFITASVTISLSPQTVPLILIISMGVLVFLKAVVGMRIYKKTLFDIVNTVFIFHLLVLSALSLFTLFGNDTLRQLAVAHISTIFVFFLLIVAIVYHIVTFLCHKKKRKASNVVAQLQRSISQQHGDPEGVTHVVMDALSSENARQE